MMKRRSGVVTTHPPAHARTEQLLATFPRRHDTSLTFTESFAAWFGHILPGAIASIEEVNATIVRRDKPWWRVTDESNALLSE